MSCTPQFNEKFIRPGMRVLVLGLGKSGYAAARFLHSLGAEVKVSEATAYSAVDGEHLEVLATLGIPCETGGHTEGFFEDIELIVASPGVPLTIAPLRSAREKGVPVIGEMAFAVPYLRTPMVAITGTNGKSTVTTLVGDLLRAAGKKVFVGGNIGTPLAEYLLGLQDCDAAVLEVSSFQLDTAGCFRPDVAVLLNVTPDHLDRYPDYEAYIRSKFLMFAGQSSEQAAILNLDDQEIARRQEFWGKGRKYTFRQQKHPYGSAAYLLGGDVVVNLGKEDDQVAEVYRIIDTAFELPPNIENAMAAILAARLMGCSQDAVQQGLCDFKPLSHRLSTVDIVDGIGFYDDSKATNMGAVKAALEGMKQPVVLIAGGRDKGGDYHYLDSVIRRKVKAMVLIGEASGKLEQAFRGMVTIAMADTMEDAVRKAYALAVRGDAVLLSPACASFDMFSGYGHRGAVFCEAVQKLALERKKTAGAVLHGLDKVSVLSCD